MDEYIGLLISAGVYQSGREDLGELWSEECGPPLFRATMSPKLF